MSTVPTDEVEHAKSQLKAGILLSLDGTATTDGRMTPKQIENAVYAVTTEKIKRVAQKYIWDTDVSRIYLSHCLRPSVLPCRSPLLLLDPLRVSSTTTVCVPTCLR